MRNLLLLLVATLASALPLPVPTADDLRLEPALRPVPGVALYHIPASTRNYLGSPALVVLPDGGYLASCDLFGKGPFTARGLVFHSADRGATWTVRAELEDVFWANLFVDNGAAYLMGASHEYGRLLIRRSTDGGRTWTAPVTLIGDQNIHTSSMPVVRAHGRIWRSCEDNTDPKTWGKNFRAFMLSAAEGSDLLDPKSWRRSDIIARDPSWLGGRFNAWLEGNAVVGPDGEVVNILRVDDQGTGPAGNVGAIIHYDARGEKATFDPAKDFIEIPGGKKKFLIRRDPRDGVYWALANPVPPSFASQNPAVVRNTLALMRSTDLRHWEVRGSVVEHPDRAKHGYQYPDWLFDGDDIIAVVRTAHDDRADGAHNQHDSNYITFHRIPSYRTYAAPMPK